MTDRDVEKINIYGTLGPACGQQEILEKMFACGMTGMRLNLSHTGLAGCGAWLQSFRRAAGKAGRKPKLLIDLQGPELRTGVLTPRELTAGEVVELAACGPGRIPVPRMVLEALKPGQQILLDDGKFLLEVCSESAGTNSAGMNSAGADSAGTNSAGANGAGIDSTGMSSAGTDMAGKDRARSLAVPCRVLRGGLLKSRKSIALPGLTLHPSTLTESDLANLRLAGEYGVTGVMLPFVRGAEDLKVLRRALGETGGEDIRIFAKIENLEGVRKLPELLPYADEIVIARGDLGNAMPLWKLPAVQYEIGNCCRKAGKPYMVVTQMLASMEHAAVPTRAEVSDIFYAVLHGASSVMLTGETAAGEYPAEAMAYLCKTVETAVGINRPHGHQRR